MELIERKLKDIGKEHYDYLIKIQMEAEETNKQTVKGAKQRHFEAVPALEYEKEHLHYVFLNKQCERRFQPHKQQRRQQRGYFSL